ncbi:Lrp/AsnC family transcriptional regulator [Sphingomonadales bacterium 56]|uniref:Lrp/AsnC family transcriptional regulator n=1 Tax=unclassified Sphingobium TaxID=2611147 RepID=UPI001A11DFF9|nr:Lrp/AsnC family transcriptional regulator [Sphingomonadales bacterium 56]MBY2959793.1 Lrp/AsnC family transcriptional regulator [Sphingomonadales bacterium 58]CAD7339796.1 DNA-binding transcriptional activator DecR [Sphingobium sp. S8]CAD7340502.1 DNA-binding transcriptional activator DecR [Sphingobium sp. S6]
MENIILDHTDRKILNLLQQDATLTVAQMADQVGLSQTPCWKRIKRFERDGLIKGRVTLLDRHQLGLGVIVIVTVKTADHSDQWLQTFAEGVSLIPEVVEFFRMSGDIDYLLKIVVRDIRDYDRIYRKLTKIAKLSDVSSSFAMQEIKSTTVLPLPS